MLFPGRAPRSHPPGRTWPGRGVAGGRSWAPPAAPSPGIKVEGKEARL